MVSFVPEDFVRRRKAMQDKIDFGIIILLQSAKS
jgi:hypothetical protein